MRSHAIIMVGVCVLHFSSFSLLCFLAIQRTGGQSASAKFMCDAIIAVAKSMYSNRRVAFFTLSQPH